MKHVYVIYAGGIYFNNKTATMMHSPKSWTNDINETYKFDTKEEADYVADRVFDYVGGGVQVKEITI